LGKRGPAIEKKKELPASRSISTGGGTQTLTNATKKSPKKKFCVKERGRTSSLRREDRLERKTSEERRLSDQKKGTSAREAGSIRVPKLSKQKRQKGAEKEVHSSQKQLPKRTCTRQKKPQKLRFEGETSVAYKVRRCRPLAPPKEEAKEAAQV